MIYTREQLINEIKKIIFSTNECEGQALIESEVDNAANKIADLISTLNDDDKEEWKNIP